MKTTLITKMVFILGAVLWVCTSCQKDHSLMTDGTSNTGPENLKKAALVHQSFNDLCDLIDASYNNGTSASRISDQNNEAAVVGPCGTITIDTISMPHVITIDFGSTNCKATDGHWYRGKIIETFTGSYRNPGTVETYVTQNLYQDNNKLEVNRTITNLGYLSDVNPAIMHFSISEYIKVTFALTALGSITEQTNMDRQWIEGGGTSSTSDDAYLLTGSHSLSFSNGTQFESEIKSPLRKENSYPFYITGVEKVNQLNNPGLGFVIDYGYPNGAQDNLALVTYNNGQTKVIQLN